MTVGARGVAVAFLATSVLYLAGALTFPFGTLAKPGPGLFPVAVGVFLCATAVALLASVGRRGDFGAGPPGPGLDREARGRVAATTGGLVGFCLLLGWLGYSAVTFLFLLLLLRRLGGAPWRRAVATALGGAVLSWYVFARLLAVPLPAGLLVD